MVELFLCFFIRYVSEHFISVLTSRAKEFSSPNRVYNRPWPDFCFKFAIFTNTCFIQFIVNSLYINNTNKLLSFVEKWL